jgi:kynurenine formamidase
VCPSGCCAGQRAQAIDELPLDWFFGSGVVLDMTANADGEAVDVSDADDELVRIGHKLQQRDVVLVRTGRDARSASSTTSRSVPP